MQGQRQTLAVVEQALVAQAAAAESRARAWEALAGLMALPGYMVRDRWGAPVVLVLAVGATLSVLHVVGVEIDLNYLADAAAYAWAGEPPECPVLPPDPLVGPEPTQ